jgi:hypothetical protein
MLRRQELEGFVEGLFGKEEALDFPERAHRGLGMLSEMWALFEGTEAVARDETKPGTVRDMEKTLRLLRQMTKDAEHEIHAILLPCKRARRQMIASLPAQKPTLHWSEQYRSTEVEKGATTRPSELFQRNCWISFEPVEGSIRVLADYIGPHKILWATDYPHPDGFFPGAPKMMMQRLEGVSPETKHGVMAGGAMGFYGLN